MQLGLNKTYDFSTYNPALAGVFVAAKVVGIVGYEEASAHADVAAKHLNIFTSLPSGSPSSPNDLVYYLIKVADDNRVKPVADVWIQSSTVSEVSSSRLRPTVMGGPEDIARLRNIIAEAGFKCLDIEVLS